MDYHVPDMKAWAFVGEGDTAQEAADAAAGALNEWAPFRKWRTADGLSVYTVTTTMTHTGDWWVCTLTAVGPDKEEKQQAYTGTTERLR